MKNARTLIFSLVAALPLVAAHGFVQDMTIDGKFIKGNGVGGGAQPSGIRQVFSQDPIKGATNPDVNCGSGAKPASLVLDANPGSQLTFDWRTANGGKWPHNTGPILTYMASCGNQTCDQFDTTKAKWFKIKQDGRKDDGNWVQQDLMNGGVANAQIPSTIAPGNYMVRHEIIALHLGTSMGGAEFYVGCAQLRIGGSGSGVPSPNDLVSLPGAYSDPDPGIFDPQAFDASAQYVFPGPAISNLAGNGTTPSKPPKKPSGGKCHLKSQPKPQSKRDTQQPVPYRPRSMSRIMRHIQIQ